MQEVWVKIIYNNLYSVSNFGRVRNDKTGRILSTRPDKKGYARASLQGKEYKVHRLVAEHFIKNPDPEKFNQVNHIDCNKLNNYIENLEWCDNSHNQIHAYANGLQDKNKKLSDEDIIKIRSEGWNYKEVMMEFGISQSHASAIVNGSKRIHL
jgi:hypothetical protein